MTPTEAAAVAAFYGLIVGVFLYREMDFKTVCSSCVASCETSSIIIVLMAMATLFGNIMTIEDVPGTIARWMLSITESKIIILLLINVLLLIVGVFMEALAAIVILTPILLPVVTGVGVSPLHFGIIMVVNLAIGFLTPPAGALTVPARYTARGSLLPRAPSKEFSHESHRLPLPAQHAGDHQRHQEQHHVQGCL